MKFEKIFKIPKFNRRIDELFLIEIFDICADTDLPHPPSCIEVKNFYIIRCSTPKLRFESLNSDSLGNSYARECEKYS